MLAICLSLAQTCNNHFQEVTLQACPWHVWAIAMEAPTDGCMTCWGLWPDPHPTIITPTWYGTSVPYSCQLCRITHAQWSLKNEILFYVLSLAPLHARLALNQHKRGMGCSMVDGCNKILSFAVDAVGHWICGKYLLISWVCNLAHSLAALHWLLRLLWQLITHWWICCVDLVNIISGMVRDRSSCRLGSCVHHERFGEPSL